jgi:hypothetical protein
MDFRHAGLKQHTRESHKVLYSIAEALKSVQIICLKLRTENLILLFRSNT